MSVHYYLLNFSIACYLFGFYCFNYMYLSLKIAIPEDAIDNESEDEDKENPDERISIRASEKRIACDEEFSDSEDEGDGRRDVRSHRPKKKHKGDDSEMSKKEADIKC